MGVWLLSFGLFYASNSWMLLTQWKIAAVSNVIVGAIAGFITVNLSHEWSHYLAAKLCSGSYTIPERVGPFVFDWKFPDNSLAKFMFMSIAGTLGGLISVGVLWQLTTPDQVGSTAILAGGLASFIFGSVIEWPVLFQVNRGGDPLQELSKINVRVLTRAAVASVAGFGLVMLTPLLL